MVTLLHPLHAGLMARVQPVPQPGGRFGDGIRSGDADEVEAERCRPLGQGSFQLGGVTGRSGGAASRRVAL